MLRVVHHAGYRRYDLGPDHPFSPVRVEMLLDLLDALGVAPPLERPEPATPADLEAVHDPEYIALVEAASRGEDPDDPAAFGLGTADNPIVPGMADGARLLAGGTRHAARLLLAGEATRVLQLGGGLHHARRRLASGFCVYNDLALAIHEMTAAGWHVAYLDLDVHHGDGVQEIFYAHDRVMTLSLHESGEYLFPGTGWLHELGRGMGRGLKLNLPLEPFTEGDSYLEVLEEVAVPALTWYRPDALVVQAGADPHWADPLADLMLTTRDFERVYRFVVRLAEEAAHGRLLVTLGGGYCRAATPRVWAVLYHVLAGLELPDELPPSWRERWREGLPRELPPTLHDPPDPYPPIPRRPEIVRRNRQLARRLLDAVAADWL